MSNGLPSPQPLAQHLAQNGFFLVPHGVMIQWGRATLFGGGGSTTITFSKAFPAGCFNVQATVIASPSSSMTYTVQVEAISRTNFQLSGNRADGTGAVTAPQMDVYWQAIGY
jgi:invasion protein IalB